MAGNPIVDTLLVLLRDGGGNAYFSEPVTQAEHMLQTAAHLAEQVPGRDALVAAGLLHDIGHLMGHEDETTAANGIDGEHEHVAADYLARWFGPEMTEPIRLHVDAKRYLCAADATYFDGLSPASVLSLELQGGPMDAAAMDAFMARPFAEDAVLLRRCDDLAKVPDTGVPPVAHYRPSLLNLVKG